MQTSKPLFTMQYQKEYTSVPRCCLKMVLKSTGRTSKKSFLSAVHIPYRMGFAPIHISILMDDAQMVKLLLEYNADTSMSCNEGTCTELAKNNPAILSLLNGNSKEAARKSTFLGKQLFTNANFADELNKAVSNRKGISIASLPNWKVFRQRCCLHNLYL
jgi:ankyrin repeat protein